MHKDATSSDLESMEVERSFEEKFGREMTREEKRLFALSATLIDRTPKVEMRTLAERRSNLRIMPSQRRRVA